MLASLLECLRRRRCGSCGHPRTAHEHYRPGSDCGECGCRRFRLI